MHRASAGLAGAQPRARRVSAIAIAAAALVVAPGARADEADQEPAEPAPAATTGPHAPARRADADPGAVPGLVAPRIAVHGFVSEGGFVVTANDYFGTRSRAGLALFEAGLNVQAEVADRLRAGVQLFSRALGSIRDASPRLDWAYLDYRWRPWLGMRAGIIRMPFGLYNEYVDIDAGRLPILLPSSVYPIRNRDVLLSHTGLGLYGSTPVIGGRLEYQAWLGALTVPRTALQLVGAELDSVNARYVTGAQLFWQPPVDGLRVGVTGLRAAIDFHVSLAPATVAALIMAGLVSPQFDGKLVITQKPIHMVIGSLEYTRGDWLVAAEYSRARTHQRSSLPMLLPPFDRDSENYYVMASYRFAPAVEAGAYYSVYSLDVDDTPPELAEPFHGFQRDLAATLRIDVNEHWLWKLEGHFMDGTASLPAEYNARPDRYWGLMMVRTTVTF